MPVGFQVSVYADGLDHPRWLYVLPNRDVLVAESNTEELGPPEDFLTGFIADEAKSEVYGRPVGLAVLPDGSLLVADDCGNVVWRFVERDDLSARLSDEVRQVASPAAEVKDSFSRPRGK